MDWAIIIYCMKVRIPPISTAVLNSNLNEKTNRIRSLVTVIYTHHVKLMGHEIEQDFRNPII